MAVQDKVLTEQKNVAPQYRRGMGLWEEFKIVFVGKPEKINAVVREKQEIPHVEKKEKVEVVNVAV